VQSELIAFVVDFADAGFKIVTRLDLTLYLLKSILDFLHIWFWDYIEWEFAGHRWGAPKSV